MKILLDTHTLLWTLNDDRALPPQFALAISSVENDLYFSAGSLWEMSIKAAKGKLTVPGGDVESFWSLAQAQGVQLLPVLPRHLIMLSALPQLHRDPFDRLLICQAKAEGMVLASVDRMVGQYDVVLLR
jgi:PIN domain nuclease of toxin-antitoxin system